MGPRAEFLQEPLLWCSVPVLAWFPGQQTQYCAFSSQESLGSSRYNSPLSVNSSTNLQCKGQLKQFLVRIVVSLITQVVTLSELVFALIPGVRYGPAQIGHSC